MLQCFSTLLTAGPSAVLLSLLLHGGVPRDAQKFFFFFFFSSWWPRSYTRERILLDCVTSEFVFPIRIETLTAFAR